MSASEPPKKTVKTWNQNRTWTQIRLRTLLLLVSFCCAFFACYAATQRWGLPAVDAYADAHFLYGAENSAQFNDSAVSYVPLLAHRTEFDPITNQRHCRYYLWLFGRVLPLNPGRPPLSHGWQRNSRKIPTNEVR